MQTGRGRAGVRTHLLWAIKLGLKWARALKEAANVAASVAAVAAKNAAGVVAALLRRLPVRTARCAALSALSLSALSLRSLLRRNADALGSRA